jgi:hypothetical protein
MAEGAIFINSGPLFSADRLESLEETPEWNEVEEGARLAYERVRESFEKHATLLAGNPSADETRYFMVNPTLHALGYMHSFGESAELGGDRVVRVDYSLFASNEDFQAALAARGSIGFFHASIGIVRAAEWGRDLSQLVAADGEEARMTPAQELDVLIRATGKDYGILSNGCDWRLYHRATSNLLNTFFQADMIAAMKSDFEDFKRFYMLFRKDAFLKDDSGESFLDRLLQ